MYKGLPLAMKEISCEGSRGIQGRNERRQKLSWRLIGSLALCLGIACAGCYSIRNRSGQPIQTEPKQEQDGQVVGESNEPPSRNEVIYSESLHIEMQPVSAHLCEGECIDISVNAAGGSPPFTYSWNLDLSDTAGPHEVCPDADTVYTVTVRDTGLDSAEFVIASDEVQGSISITVSDECGTVVPLDRGVDSGVLDSGDDSDTGSHADSGDTNTKDRNGSAIVAPCNPNCPDLVWVEIPGGTFMMGSPDGIGNDSEHPQHEVTIQSFRILKTEVTVSQYGRCFEAGVCSEPGINDGRNWGEPDRDNHPVNEVDRYQAREFAQWVGGRLPSEAEWEYAARSGGQDILYPWGDQTASCEYAMIQDNITGGCGTRQTMEVCSKPLGNTTQGLCDMAGNVGEWVEDDWHFNYEGAPSDGQAWIENPRSQMVVYRGGSWINTYDSCRTASRFFESSVQSSLFGFRVARDLE